MHGLAFPWLALGGDPGPGILATVVAVAGAGAVLFGLAKNGLELFPYVRPPRVQPSLGLTVRMAPEPPSSPLDRGGWTRKSRGLRIFLSVYVAIFGLGGLLAMLVGGTESSPGHRSLIGSVIRSEAPHAPWSAGAFLVGGFLSVLVAIWLFFALQLLRSSSGEPWIGQRLLALDGDFDTVFSGCLRALPAAGATVVAIDREGLTDATSGVLVARVGGNRTGHPNGWSERMRVRVGRGDCSPRMVEVTSQSIQVRFYGRRNARNVARFCTRLME